MEIVPADWGNLPLLLSAIVIICVIVKEKERWLFMYGVIFFAVLLAGLIWRR